MSAAIIRLVWAFGIGAVVVGCVAPDPPYRTTRMSDPICANEHTLANSNLELSNRASGQDFTAEQLEALRKCPNQKHLLPETPIARVMLFSAAEDGEEISQDALAQMALQGQPDNDWTRLAANAGRPLGPLHSQSYHLAFVELEETDVTPERAPDSLSAQQTQIVTRHLDRLDKAGIQNVVVLYVHGWRHDAALRDGDVRKFRRVLGYTRAALNTRCIENGTYCNADVTGVFASWYGRAFDEGETESNADGGVGGGIKSIVPVLSFWNRFDRSQCLGNWRPGCDSAQPVGTISPLKGLLDRVEGELGLNPGNPKADKLMVVGHSMGGNILANMLREDAVNTVATHPIGAQMAPLVGDLVVLINPASRAENWVPIQEKEREKAGFAKDDHRLTCHQHAPDATQGCQQKDWRNLAQWHGLYPATQRPIYISLTSTKGWGTLKDAKRDVEYDTATGRVFPLSQDVIDVDRADGKIALGHQFPDYANTGLLNGRAVGTSHEMAVLDGARTDDEERFRSSYANTMTAKAAWCAPADGWLLRARTTDRGQPTPRNRLWDYGYVPLAQGDTRVSSRNVGGAFNKAAVQWRQAIYPTGKKIPHLSVSPWTTPFWNTRVLDSAIRGHAGWANYATWCALSQLVLDDVTRPQDAPMVEKALAMGQPVDPHLALEQPE